MNIKNTITYSHASFLFLDINIDYISKIMNYIPLLQSKHFFYYCNPILL